MTVARLRNSRISVHFIQQVEIGVRKRSLKPHSANASGKIKGREQALPSYQASSFMDYVVI